MIPRADLQTSLAQLISSVGKLAKWHSHVGRPETFEEITAHELTTSNY